MMASSVPGFCCSSGKSIHFSSLLVIMQQRYDESQSSYGLLQYVATYHEYFSNLTEVILS
jgi:hypothetical protein